MTTTTGDNKAACHYFDSSYWDPSVYEPFGTAILYESFKDPVQCGHAVRLDRMIERIHSTASTTACTCPICGAPVLYVEDGMASKKDSLPVITFKYGKMIFRLSVPSSPSSTRSVLGAEAGRSESKPSLFWPIWWLLSPIIRSIEDKTYERQSTAQQRIAYVLGFDFRQGMKILSKGKVVYPPIPQNEDNNIIQRKISHMLIDCSQQQTSQDHGKINFLVLGTAASSLSDLMHKEEKRRLDANRTVKINSFWNFIVSVANVSADLSRKLLIYCVTVANFAWRKSYGIVRPLIERGNTTSNEREQQ